MSTILTSSGGYAAATDLIARYSETELGDYVLDKGVKATATLIAASTYVTAALKSASGELEAAVLLGGSYTPTDIAALTGSTKEYMLDIVCTLAYWRLRRRRQPDMEESDALSWARAQLTLLEKGERIFGIQEVADASLPKVAFLTEGEQLYRNGLVEQARAFFGRRIEHNIPGQG